MPERWERTLKSLRRLEMSPEHVWGRIEEGPRPEPPTPVRTRVLAGVVAIAIIAAAGALAWNAFGPRNGTTSGVSSASRMTATLHGVSLVYPASWKLVDLWPLAGDIASWPEPGSVIDVPEGTPERGGLPVLQLSNRDLGLGSACGVELNGDAAVLYVAANGGPYLIDAQGHPRWPETLTRADGPCGPGWYAYRESWLDTGDGSGEARPYLVYAAFGPDVPDADRDGIFAAFSTLTFSPANDFLYPPAEPSPTYVQGSPLNDQTSDSYLIDQVRVLGPKVDPRTGEPDPKEIELAFRVRWSGDTFPGVHSCTYTAYSSDGAVVGTTTDALVSLAPSNEVSPGQSIRVAAEAASADASCSPERIDEILAYDVVRAEVSSVAGTTATVSYMVRWPESLAPDEWPSPNACEAVVQNANTDVVGSSTFSISAGPTHPTSFGWNVPLTTGADTPSSPEGLTATVRCRPFGSAVVGGIVEPTSSPTGDLSGGVLVPDVLGLQRAAAERMLEDLGLEPVVEPAGEPADDLVKGQSPEPGTVVDPGTTVIIAVACFPAPCPSPVNGETIYDPCSCSTRR